jgi:hypothetical protein
MAVQPDNQENRTDFPALWRWNTCCRTSSVCFWRLCKILREKCKRGNYRTPTEALASDLTELICYRKDDKGITQFSSS